VGGLGESERADRVQAANGRHPALLLHVASEQVDRLHRELGLDAEKRAQAVVAAVQLHDDQAARERAHAGAAVASGVVVMGYLTGSSGTSCRCRAAWAVSKGR
jgi:hypothetical protein